MSGRKRQDELLFSPNTTSTTLGASPEGKGNDETGTNADLPFYSLSIIAAATENFSIANKLGEGGFGLANAGADSSSASVGAVSVFDTTITVVEAR
ncbi:hypothetical protein RJ639_036605 [Escallonia herrerae]|uniref:Uncharacterized protein n=1 Tax=Escallonia herrerae TaxID=1293975 RepID=A0AA88X570_9ASTE|nr:hypothetical protein RJ639_036605 [Escallonia herrerae]